MRADDQFHVGIVVDDLDHGLAELAELFGYEWCDEIDVEQAVASAAGETPVRFRFRYSRSTPRVEVIQSQPGTLWAPADSGIHHLGYWSDDVAADSAALERAGYALEASGAGSGDPVFAFHRNAHGPRIELVNRAAEPFMRQMWGA